MPYSRLSRPTALCALFVLVLSAWSAACNRTPAGPTAVSADTWAVVNGETITREEVEQAFRRVRDGSQPELSPEETLAAKLSLLNDMIVQELLLARARELKIEVTDSELDTAFNQAKANIPEDAFNEELKRRNLSAGDMRDGLRRELLTQKVIEKEVGEKVAVTDQDITDFYNANRGQFNVPEEAYHIAQIVVTPVRDPQVANRTGDDAATPEAAQAKVQMLLGRLKQGASFRDLAADYS
jgi:parvulin-like peptidyl-prolyl isomerase